MQMQKTNENLLCNYLNRLLLEFPFLKVKMEETGVSIERGKEVCNWEDGSNTHQEFKEYERYDVKTDVGSLQKLFSEKKSGYSCEKISENELLVTSRRKVEPKTEIPEEDKFFGNICSFKEYIKTTKRTVLMVDKERYFVDGRYIFDPIPARRIDYVWGTVVGGIGPVYDTMKSSGVILNRFAITRESVENLNQDLFEIYILKESEYQVCYEIINKSL